MYCITFQMNHVKTNIEEYHSLLCEDASALTKLLLMGSLYWVVQKRARPSLYRKMRKGSQEVTRTYIRRSNLNPSIMKGCELKRIK